MLTRLALVGLLAATLLAYAPVRQAGFVYEDSVYLSFATRALTAADVLTARGLTALTFRGNGLVGGLEPLGYHTVNLALLLLVGLAFFGLARTLLPTPYALVACALCLLHPIQTEAVAYVAGRGELIAALGTILAVWALAGPVTWTQAGLAFMATVAAIGGKELGIVALPLIALHAFVIRGLRLSWRVCGAIGLGLLVMAALAWPVLQTRIIGNGYLAMTERGGLGYFAMQAWALVTLLGNALLPLGLTVDHDYELVSRGMALACAGGVVVAAVACWSLRRRAPVVCFGLLWALVALAPRFFVRQPEFLNEHQVFTPFLGLWLAVSAGLLQVEAWRTSRAEVVPESPCAVSV